MVQNDTRTDRKLASRAREATMTQSGAKFKRKVTRRAREVKIAQNRRGEWHGEPVRPKWASPFIIKESGQESPSGNNCPEWYQTK